MLVIPKLSRTMLPFIFEQIFQQKKAEVAPATNPTAIAAPIFIAVPATDPYMMAPVIVPSKDPLMPILVVGLMTIPMAQLKMTLALSEKKTEMKASCQIQALADSLEEVRVYLSAKRVVVVVKAMNRKKVPRWAKTDDFYELQNESSQGVLGALRMRLRMSPQLAEKRYTLDIWQSSKNLLSGELLASSTHRKWLRFQQRLNRVECITTCGIDNRPNTPNNTTNCPIAFARAMRRLQKSRYTSSPPILYLQSLAGSVAVGAAP